MNFSIKIKNALIDNLVLQLHQDFINLGVDCTARAYVSFETNSFFSLITVEVFFDIKTKDILNWKVIISNMPSTFEFNEKDVIFSDSLIPQKELRLLVDQTIEIFKHKIKQ